jgi:hypothetical protein
MTKQPKQVQTSTNPAILIAGVIILAAIGIYRTGIYQNSVLPSTEERGSNTESWKRITNPNALFFSKIFLDRTNTYVTIPIKFDDGIKVSWISLDSTSSAQPSEFLMTHPQLDGIDWPRLEKGVVNLYQRNQTYASIDAFVANPPPRNKTAVENGIINLDYYQNVPGYPIDDSFDINRVDYILTTYENPVKENDAYYYENIIDASSAVVNSNENLSWRINVPSASSESAFYLGQIHIDYNRTQ